MAKVYYKDDRVVLIHGDCIEAMQKLKCRFKACITDPPYGTTACKWDNIIPFEPMWECLKTLMLPGGAICLFGSEPFSSKLRCSNIKQFKYDWTWLKEKGTGFLNAKKMPLRDTEIISVFGEKMPEYHPQMREGTPYTCVNSPDKQKGTNRDYAQVCTENDGWRYPCTTLRFNRVRRTEHPTQKPVDLVEYLIKTYTDKDDNVLDFTCGSGTTLIAGLNTGRKVVGIESDEGYCEVAKQRILKWYEEHK